MRAHKLLFAALAFGIMPAFIITVPASAAEEGAGASAPVVVSRAVLGATPPEHAAVNVQRGGEISAGSGSTVTPSPAGYKHCLEWRTANKTIYYKDRFHACHFIYVYAAWYDCSTTPCTLIGYVRLDQMTDFVGTTGKQAMTANMYFRPGKVWGTVHLSQSMSLKLACTNGPKAVCAVNHGYVTHTLAKWLTSPKTTYKFDTGKSVGVPHGNDHGKDGVNTHGITEHETFGGLTAKASIVAFRCDHASYAVRTAAKGACIFSQVMMTWTISLANKEFPKVAKHIWLAWKQPGTGTYPPAPKGKKVKIPGFASTKAPLTRLYPPYDMKRYTANNATAKKACIAKWGKGYSDGNKYQCDEYPFASTYQGASTANGHPWWYSVQVLPTKDNSTAGAALGTWLTANHILDSDAYWVAVTS